MEIFCVYTQQHKPSVDVAKRCWKSGKDLGYNVIMYPAIFWQDMDAVHTKYNLRKKYKPVPYTSTTTSTTCPATRMANGTTHYLLYRYCVEKNKPICIVEHDSIFVGRIPEAKENGVIQISSHTICQLDEDLTYNCGRAKKMRIHQPNHKFVWPKEEGVVKHPLTGTNGTSGYIISPSAAEKMIQYVETDGIAYADRVRTEWIGEGNLYLQIPQSVFCLHDVKSARIKE